MTIFIMCYLAVGLTNYLSYRPHRPYNPEANTIVGFFLRSLLFSFFVFLWGPMMIPKGSRTLIYLAYVSNEEYMSGKMRAMKKKRIKKGKNLVWTPLFRMRVERDKTKYTRRKKHKLQD